MEHQSTRISTSYIPPVNPADEAGFLHCDHTTEEESNQWADAIDRAIKGEHVTFVYDTWKSAKHDFELVLGLIHEMGLWHEATCRQGLAEIEVYGSIAFTTYGYERRRW